MMTGHANQPCPRVRKAPNSEKRILPWGRRGALIVEKKNGEIKMALGAEEAEIFVETNEIRRLEDSQRRECSPNTLASSKHLL